MMHSGERRRNNINAFRGIWGRGMPFSSWRNMLIDMWREGGMKLLMINQQASHGSDFNYLMLVMLRYMEESLVLEGEEGGKHSCFHVAWKLYSPSACLCLMGRTSGGRGRGEEEPSMLMIRRRRPSLETACDVTVGGCPAFLSLQPLSMPSGGVFFMGASGHITSSNNMEEGGMPILCRNY